MPREQAIGAIDQIDRRSDVFGLGGILAGLLDQAQAALAGGDAEKAAALLDAADARVAEGGAEGSAGRREGLRSDLGVLTELEKAGRFRWTPDGPKLPGADRVAARYKAVLVSLAPDAQSSGPQAVADRVARSAVRDRLVAAMDYVLWEGQSPLARPVRAALRAADPDGFRDSVRDAWVAGGTAAAAAGPAASAAVLAALAGRADAADQPPGFVAVLGATRPCRSEWCGDYWGRRSGGGRATSGFSCRWRGPIRPTGGRGRTRGPGGAKRLWRSPRTTRSPTSPWEPPFTTGVTTTGRWPSTRRRSGSTRASPRPTTTWGLPCTGRGTWTGRWPSTRRRSG
jgi:hypothetical protein